MTVGELAALLGQYDPNEEIDVVYDARCARGEITSIEVEGGKLALIID